MDDEEFSQRKIVLEEAAKFVDPIVARHGLESVRNQTAPLTVGYTSTAVDQHIDHIIRVANWFLDKD